MIAEREIDQVNDTSEFEEDYSVLPASLLRLTDELTNYGMPTAPVEIPGQDELTVRLVNISLLHKLDELNADIQIMMGMFFLALAGLLNVVINILTGTQSVDERTWFMTIALGIFTAAFGFLLGRFFRRLKLTREKLLGDRRSNRNHSLKAFGLREVAKPKFEQD